MATTFLPFFFLVFLPSLYAGSRVSTMSRSQTLIIGCMSPMATKFPAPDSAGSKLNHSMQRGYAGSMMSWWTYKWSS
uniref:Putative secreted protein n=1 Tax=Ixodes ricinus TaxID=34613 RepID=A0A6B0U4B8_IXORI